MTPEESITEETGPVPIGERLRRQREARGFSLEDVATQTRIPIRHLLAIENEDWDALPAVTYCIGFVRSYANAVGLDGASLGREVRDSLGGARTRNPAPEYYQPADPSRVPPKSLAIIAALIAVVLIIVYAVWRSSFVDPPEEAEAPPPATQPAQQAAQPRQAPAAQPAAPAAGPVTLVATDEAWIRVEDAATGATLFQGTLGPGERFAVPPEAQAPVIRTGRPQAVRAMVGNRDLGPVDPVERTVSGVSLKAEDLAAR